MHKTLFSLLIPVFILAPSFASADATSTAALEKEINELSQKIENAKTELDVTDSSVSFPRNLSSGSTGDDVKTLQRILNQDPATQIASSGPGSPGNETTYFGSLTTQAVIRFQEKYADEVLAPHNLTQGTGFVGASTRAKLEALAGSSDPTTQALDKEIERLFDQVVILKDKIASGSAEDNKTQKQDAENTKSESGDADSDLETHTNADTSSSYTSPAPPADTRPVFTHNLSEGDTGVEVKVLQTILNLDPATQIASSGPGSPGNETTYFGSLTTQAVARFQEKYADEVLAPHNLTQGTGFVGASTRAKLNQFAYYEE